MKYLISIALLFCIASCYTDKKATKQVTRAILEKPSIAADLTRKAFPCITTQSDTFVNIIDTTINVDCPDTSSNSYFTIHDTIVVRKNTGKTIKVPVPAKVVEKVVVQKVKDSADIIVLNTQLSAANGKIGQLENKLSNRNKYILYLIILSVILGGLNYIQWGKSR